MLDRFKIGDRVILQHDFYVDTGRWCLSIGRQGDVVEVRELDVLVDFDESNGVTARWVAPYFIRVISAVDRLAMVADD